MLEMSRNDDVFEAISGKHSSSDMTLQRYVGFQMDKLRRTKASSVASP